nr:hypothetical protein 16 [bacterium]
MVKLTENKIQIGLYKNLYFQGWRYFLPNVKWFNWESDLLAFDIDGRVWEFEIKLTVSDFMQDMRKKKHVFMNCRNLATKRLPNRFYYVVPFNLIPASAVPDHSGLVYYREGFHQPVVKFIKHGPDLTTELVGEGEFRTLVEKSNDKMVKAWVRNGAK